MSRLGNSRNDSRAARLPKNEEKRAEQLKLREWAMNNGVSIRVAKAYFSESKEEEKKIEEIPENEKLAYTYQLFEQKKGILEFGEIKDHGYYTGNSPEEVIKETCFDWVSASGGKIEITDSGIKIFFRETLNSTHPNLFDYRFLRV